MSILLDQMNSHCEGSVPDMSSQMPGTFNSGENLGRDKRLSVFNLHVGKTQSDCMPKMSTDAEVISEKENNISKQLRKEKGDSCEHKAKQQSSSVVSKSNTPASVKNQQGTSKMSLKVMLSIILTICVKAYCDLLMLQGNIGDYKIRIPGSHNSKEIRDILINLHDQFEEMDK